MVSLHNDQQYLPSDHWEGVRLGRGAATMLALWVLASLGKISTVSGSIMSSIDSAISRGQALSHLLRLVLQVCYYLLHFSESRQFNLHFAYFWFPDNKINLTVILNKKFQIILLCCSRCPQCSTTQPFAPQLQVITTSRPRSESNPSVPGNLNNNVRGLFIIDIFCQIIMVDEVRLNKQQVRPALAASSGRQGKILSRSEN